MRTITAFEVVDHGIDGSQYFPGCGVACTGYADVGIGAGSNFAEAVDDALESLAQGDWHTVGMEERILSELGVKELPVKPAVGDGDPDDIYYYVAIRVKE